MWIDGQVPDIVEVTRLSQPGEEGQLGRGGDK